MIYYVILWIVSGYAIVFLLFLYEKPEKITVGEILNIFVAGLFGPILILMFLIELYWNNGDKVIWERKKRVN